MLSLYLISFKGNVWSIAAIAHLKIKERKKVVIENVKAGKRRLCGANALTWLHLICFPLLTPRTYTFFFCREPFPTCYEESLCIYSCRNWYRGRFPGVWIYDWSCSGLGRKEELSGFPGGLNACFIAECASALAQVCERTRTPSRAILPACLSQPRRSRTLVRVRRSYHRRH